MTDWNKLKVPELKTELKKRGLLQTGVKAALVARLEAAENDDGMESEATIHGDAGNVGAESATSPDTVSPILPSDGGTDTSPDAPLESQPSGQSQGVMVMKEITEKSSQVGKLSTQPAETVETSKQASQDKHTSSLPSVEPQEAIEDRQKRKRRSQSPPPSTADIARKRIRPSTTVEGEVITTKEDAQWVEKHNAVDAAEVNAESKEVSQSGVGPGPTIVDIAKEEVEVEEVNMAIRESVDLDVTRQDEFSKTRDSRQFKGLFSGDPPQGVAMAHSLSRDSAEEIEVERSISPAIHPATAGLYIRDIMRPLNPAQLKTHVSTLATPPGQDSDAGVITSFYIDSIRTHAFISFASVSAASRVRSALHDRVWPEHEKTRKPLWVDFVPVERIEEWVELEQESNTGGRSMTKKWEVFYDIDEDRHVTASLQEASNMPRPSTRNQSLPASGSFGGSSQTAMPAREFAPPSGPRSYHPPRVDQSALDHDRNKLNDLFKSTKAKPVLYWQPVPKELAHSRLDHLEDAYSKDVAAGARITGDVNRYTFEEGDMLVDRGVELVPGLRPPPGYRAPRPGGTRPGFGGGPGGYRGGRGGFGGGRGDSYSGGYGGGRSDPYSASSRQQNPYDSYRGDRRGSRDYGRY